MRASLARWVGDADALRHLEHFRVSQAATDFTHIRTRADDYYISLVGELFDRMRDAYGDPTQWARLGNALGLFASDREDHLRAVGVSASEAAFFAAAAFPPERQVTMVLQACAKAYCRFFPEQKLAACDPSFVTTPLSAAFAWPQLHEAILWRDASGYALRVQRAFQTHNLTVAQKAPPPIVAPPAPASTAAP